MEDSLSACSLNREDPHCFGDLS